MSSKFSEEMIGRKNRPPKGLMWMIGILVVVLSIFGIITLMSWGPSRAKESEPVNSTVQPTQVEDNTPQSKP
jgi:hypothetical protein